MASKLPKSRRHKKHYKINATKFYEEVDNKCVQQATDKELKDNAALSALLEPNLPTDNDELASAEQKMREQPASKGDITNNQMLADECYHQKFSETGNTELLNIRSEDEKDTGVSRKPYYIYRLSEYNEYSYGDAVFSIVCILLYLFDIGSDIRVIYLHFQVANYWFSILSLLCIVIPSLTMTIFSLTWYVEDYKEIQKQKFVMSENSTFRWCLRFLFTLLQFGQLIR